MRPTIEQVLARETPNLLAIPGIVGTAEGISGDEACILVFVAEKTAALEAAIPARLDGYPVEIQEVGEIRPLGS